mmetsp:Transcript_15265/g.17127  ORF Transcript_15265/g.17127 Transcript_15265/m.17127 type:complete len:378 (+) Transcript_15265:2-1135(+)
MYSLFCVIKMSHNTITMSTGNKRSPITNTDPSDQKQEEEGDEDCNTKRLKTTTDEHNKRSNVMVSPAPIFSSSTVTTSSSPFRAWSTNISEGDGTNSNSNSASPSTVYTFKCIFGNPSKPLPSFLKTSKVSRLKDILQSRKQSTEGSKKVLLDRLQTDLPYVIIELDSRECLQRLVNSFLYYMKWDNGHLFECKMPARGPMKAGTSNLWYESFGMDMGMAVIMPTMSLNPNNLDKRVRKLWQSRLDAAGLDWSDIDRAKREPKARGKWRKLEGSGFDPHSKSSSCGWDDDDDDDDDDNDEPSPPGGLISLRDLALVKGDKIQMKYDFGDNHTFTIIMLEKHERQTTHKEVKIYGHDTRVVLVNKSTTCSMPNQYGDH